LVISTLEEVQDDADEDLARLAILGLEAAQNGRRPVAFDESPENPF
jgi:hypothetical protein